MENYNACFVVVKRIMWHVRDGGREKQPKVEQIKCVAYLNLAFDLLSCATPLQD